MMVCRSEAAGSTCLPMSELADPEPQIQPRIFDPEPRVQLRVFDPQRVLALCNDDLDLARDMSELFLEIAGTLAERVKEAVVAADPETVVRVAHTLKGAAANLTGERLESTARRLMAVGKRRQLGCSEPVLEEMNAELARLTQALREFRTALPGRAA